MTINAIDNLEQIENFVQNTIDPKDILNISILPQDASTRKYYRITTNIQLSYIVMDDSVDQTNIIKFVNINNKMKSVGIAVPEIYSISFDNKYLLLEDFGSVSLNQYLSIQRDAEEEVLMYHNLMNVILKMQSIEEVSDLKRLNFDIIQEGIELYVQYYLSPMAKDFIKESDKKELIDIWQSLYNNLPTHEYAFSHRDFHADNILIRDGKFGKEALGIIDHQDAILAPKVYDVISILEDARRVVDKQVAKDCLYYFENTLNMNKKDFSILYSFYSCQRNMRILGVFAKKASFDKSSPYLKYVQTVVSYLTNSLSHPYMINVKKWINKFYS
jgi:aminoglycoside/choline kinase family phosphotransferase